MLAAPKIDLAADSISFRASSLSSPRARIFARRASKSVVSAAWVPGCSRSNRLAIKPTIRCVPTSFAATCVVRSIVGLLSSDIFSSIGLRNSDGTRRGSGVHRSIRPALAFAATLALAACDADPVAARAVLLEHGLHAAALHLAGPFDRPCRFGEPFALRFVAIDDDGARVSGALCSATEDARDARVLLDAAEGS